MFQGISLLLALLCLSAAQKQGSFPSQSDQELDKGQVRLAGLLKRSAEAEDGILRFGIQDFDEFVMKYPRPYDLVIYFHAKKIPLSIELMEEFNYTARLYGEEGGSGTPTFFVVFEHLPSTQEIFKYFGFNSAPCLVVSKPHMAVVKGSQFRDYLKDFSWWVSSTDGVVNARKLLDFINKRTGKQVSFRPTQQTVKWVLSVFTGAAVLGVVLFKLLRAVWSHWVFWFFGSLLVYAVCMSGIVHCILNDSIRQDLAQRARLGKTTFFTLGGNNQSFFEGCLLSLVVLGVALALLAVALAGQKLRERYAALLGLLGLAVAYYGIAYVERVYVTKSWYGPSFKPPEGYLRGPLSLDQGHNI